MKYTTAIGRACERIRAYHARNGYPPIPDYIGLEPDYLHELERDGFVYIRVLPPVGVFLTNEGYAASLKYRRTGDVS